MYYLTLNFCRTATAGKVATITHKFKWISRLLIFIIGLIISGPVITGENFRLNKDLLKKAEIKYGKDALRRLSSWEDLIRQDKSTSDLQKIEKVNTFFNKMIIFVNDADLWGVNDYWATPIETLCRGAGDCEDFAIAKYFTLRAMGVADNKLNISYVKALQYNMHHVVLAYYSKPGAEPVILDNLIDTIELASKRTDLMPIFSFNGTGLWLAHQRGQGKLAGASSRIVPWQELLSKMSASKI